MVLKIFDICSGTDHLGTLEILVSDFYAKHGYPYQRTNHGRNEDIRIYYCIRGFSKFDEMETYKMRK